MSEDLGKPHPHNSPSGRETEHANITLGDFWSKKRPPRKGAKVVDEEPKKATRRRRQRSKEKVEEQEAQAEVNAALENTEAK